MERYSFEEIVIVYLNIPGIVAVYGNPCIPGNSSDIGLVVNQVIYSLLELTAEFEEKTQG